MSATNRAHRRELLRAALGLLAAAPALTACDLLDPAPKPPPGPDPLTELYQETWDLAARYRATLGTASDLAPRLLAISETHQAHLAELAAIMFPAPAPSPSRPAGSAATDIEELRSAEAQAGDTAVRACLAAPPGRAVLLGEIAAARATHVEVLA